MQINVAPVPALAFLTVEELRIIFARARYAAELQAFYAAQTARAATR